MRHKSSELFWHAPTWDGVIWPRDPSLQQDQGNSIIMSQQSCGFLILPGKCVLGNSFSYVRLEYFIEGSCGKGRGQNVYFFNTRDKIPGSHSDKIPGDL